MTLQRIMAALLACGLLGMAHQKSVAAGFSFGEYVTYPTGYRPRAIAIGDVTGDGRDDVVLTTQCDVNCFNSQRIYVYVQQPNGTLAAPSKYSLLMIPGNRSTGLALGDMNQDGILDIVAGANDGITLFNSNPAGPQRFRINPVNGGKIVDGEGADYLGIMDIDRDGNLDVIAQTWSRGANLYYGNGKGGIRQPPVHIFTWAAGWNDLRVADVSSDGYPDLLISSFQTDAQRLLTVNRHDGVGGFTATTEPDSYNPGYRPGGIAVGDFNHDGRADVATSQVGSNYPAKVSVLPQLATGLLGQPQHFLSQDCPNALVAGDIDGDGRDDLLTAHNCVENVGVYLQGDSGLTDEQLVPLVRNSGASFSVNSQGLALGDLNGDGCKDLAIADWGEGLGLLYGQGCEPSPPPPLPDLSVALAKGTSSISVGLANTADAGPIESPVVELNLSVRSGTLQTGALPENCVLQGQTARSRKIECALETLVPAATAGLAIPAIFSGIGLEGALTVTAQARTHTTEKALQNNYAIRKFIQQSAPAMVGVRSTSSKQALGKQRTARLLPSGVR